MSGPTSLTARLEEKAGEANRRKLERARDVAKKLNPLIAVMFIMVYWLVGMYNVWDPQMRQ